MTRIAAEVISLAAVRARRSDPDLGDLRFRTLIGEEAWAALAAATRARFGKRVAG